MIKKIVKGNILKSEAEALVNPVNCVGVLKNVDLEGDTRKKSFGSNINVPVNKTNPVSPQI